MRSVILHMHLPKTGGSTLRSILDREFGGRHYNLSHYRRAGESTYVRWDDVGGISGIGGMVPAWDWPEGEVFDMLGRCADAVAVSRHGMLMDPANMGAGGGGADPRSSEYRLFPVLFLRNPVLWHMSLYRQQRRDPALVAGTSTDLRVAVAKTGSLGEYTRFCLDHPEILRVHAPMFNWTEGAVGRMLDHMGLYQIGVTERFDESLVVAEAALEEDFPGIDLSYPERVNEGKRGATDSEKMGVLREELGGAMLDELESACPLAVRAYEAAVAEVERRISRIPGFEGRLAGFRERCNSRAGNTLRRPPP
ncbi:MAG: hypothetical protein MPJ08_01585 [Nitrosopumilus sp.]|nr:hypothetical protein [Nitrosopumilus sp.]